MLAKSKLLPFSGPDAKIFVNELSIHEQFERKEEFYAAFARLMEIREKAKIYGRKLYCSRNFCNAKPLPGVTMHEALQGFAAVGPAMRWLSEDGPFWDKDREHGCDDWLECGTDVVTDSAVGEAAYRALHGRVPCALVSITPSDWDFSPVEVVWKQDNLNDRLQPLENWRGAVALENALRAAEPPFESWDDLRNASTKGGFANLIFAEDCFEPLAEHSFCKYSAQNIRFLLEILDERADASNGAACQDFFQGANALFSDSSDTEKGVFKEKLTFRHPETKKPLLCPRHGKTSHPQFPLRLHYHWPEKAGKPVYVVYVGPKLTPR